MKIKFKDTLIKENIPAYICILAILGTAIMYIAAGQWWTAAWALLAGYSMFAVIILGTNVIQLSNTLMKKDRELFQERMLTDNLKSSIDDITNEKNAYAAKYEDLQAEMINNIQDPKFQQELFKKYIEQNGVNGEEYGAKLRALQALDDLYAKLTKQPNAHGEEQPRLKNAPTTLPVHKKKPVISSAKKVKYTEKEAARIREEMKAGGMIKEKDEE